MRTLKIDGGFIERLPDDPVDQSLVRAMVTMARGLGVRTVAEYVTSDRALEMLRRCGVDAAQGYYVGPPGPLPEEAGQARLTPPPCAIVSVGLQYGSGFLGFRGVTAPVRSERKRTTGGRAPAVYTAGQKPGRSHDGESPGLLACGRARPGATRP